MTPPQYLDTMGLWDATVSQPELALAALALSEETLAVTALPSLRDIRSVVVLGMGTSATAAQLVAAYAAGHGSLPVSVVNGYDVPAFVGPHTLAFAVSHSGDTEETCAAAAAVLERGARLAVVSGGGALANTAVTHDLPLFRVPAGSPVARTALAALATPVLAALSHIGAVDDVGPALRGALAWWQQRRDYLVSSPGPTEEMARRIGRTIPLVYGSTGVSAVSARHWKVQINENVKTAAFFAVQPELSHNEVVGWGQNGDVTRQVLSLITLRHHAEPPQVARRFELVLEATDEVMANVLAVWTDADDDLSRFFDLAFFGDLVSLHLAGREGIDPGPTPARQDVEAGLQH